MPYDVLWLGIDIPLEKLEKKIRLRLHARLKAGMIAEAKRLHARGLSYKRMHELGLEYRYMADYVQEKISKEEMTERLARAIRDYAKRQVRWFKRNPEIVWVTSSAQALTLARKFIGGRSR